VINSIAWDNGLNIVAKFTFPTFIRWRVAMKTDVNSKGIRAGKMMRQKCSLKPIKKKYLPKRTKIIVGR
jgi:hypothetical protein